MDKIIESLSRHQNTIAGAAIAVVGIFCVLLFFSDAGAAAQALGNLIGAALGALGAGAAVYWQIDRKRVDEASQLSEIRRSAFRALTTDLIIKIADISESIDMLVADDISGAGKSIQNGAVGVFGVDARFADRLNEFAPRDAEVLDRLRAVNGRLWELSKSIVRGPLQTYPKETKIVTLADAIAIFCEVAIEFVSERRAAIEASDQIIFEAQLCIQRLVSTGLTSGSILARNLTFIHTR